MEGLFLSPIAPPSITLANRELSKEESKCMTRKSALKAMHRLGDTIPTDFSKLFSVCKQGETHTWKS